MTSWHVHALSNNVPLLLRWPVDSPNNGQLFNCFMFYQNMGKITNKYLSFLPVTYFYLTPCHIFIHNGSGRRPYPAKVTVSISTYACICYVYKHIGIPVPGEFPAQRPVTPSFDVFFDLRLNKRLIKRSWGWWFETLPHPLWRHSNGNAWVLIYDGIRLRWNTWTIIKLMISFHIYVHPFGMKIA